MAPPPYIDPLNQWESSYFASTDYYNGSSQSDYLGTLPHFAADVDAAQVGQQAPASHARVGNDYAHPFAHRSFPRNEPEPNPFWSGHHAYPDTQTGLAQAHNSRPFQQASIALPPTTSTVSRAGWHSGPHTRGQSLQQTHAGLMRAPPSLLPEAHRATAPIVTWASLEPVPSTTFPQRALQTPDNYADLDHSSWYNPASNTRNFADQGNFSIASESQYGMESSDILHSTQDSVIAGHFGDVARRPPTQTSVQSHNERALPLNQGPGHVLDRTGRNFSGPGQGFLQLPMERGRHASRSESSSSATIPCEHESCNRMFRSRSDRNHHHRWHGAKKYFCGICGTGFIANKDLKRHSLSHGPKTYFCRVVGCSSMGFCREDHLTRHMQTHDTSRTTSPTMSRGSSSRH